MTAANTEETTEPAVPEPCMACGGSGEVISNLGGKPSKVTCPWCDGSGLRIPDHDAQAARRAAEEGPEPPEAA